MTRASAMKNTPSIREIVVPATEQALNAAVMENQIEPDKIISVILLPRHTLAIGDYEAKYRLIYRT
jgi:chorismate mutase